MSVSRGNSANGEDTELEGGSGIRAEAPTASAMRRTLARARDGKPLDLDEATVLLHARGEDLQKLLEYASRTRDAGLEAAGRPGVITYSRKVFIPLTRLCRDRCGYCTFATVPHRLDSLYLEPDHILEIARQGAELGCKEALFTLGDKPEDRWRQAREWLDAHGYDDTLSYVRAMAIRVLEETGLLPHLNPGVLSWQDFQRLKPVAPSMGMMLETTANRLYRTKGAPHFGSPDKDPRVQVREQAGLLEHADRHRPDVGQGVVVAVRVQPLPRRRPAVLRPVTEGDQGFGAAGSRPDPGDLEDLLDLQERGRQPVRDGGEGAVMAAVPAQPGERDEDLPRVGDHARAFGGLEAGVPGAARVDQESVQVLAAGVEQDRGLVHVERLAVPGAGQRPAHGRRGGCAGSDSAFPFRLCDLATTRVAAENSHGRTLRGNFADPSAAPPRSGDPQGRPSTAAPVAGTFLVLVRSSNVLVTAETRAAGR